MIFSLTLLSADTPADTIDLAAYSDRELLDLVVKDIDDRAKQMHADVPGGDVPVCDWTMVECDERGVVIKIFRQGFMGSGSLALEFLPLQIQSCSLSNQSYPKICGTLCTPQLPRGLQLLSLTHLGFYGAVDMTQLPPQMNLLFLHHNNFSGSCDLNKLSETIQSIDISHNDFSGSVDLTRLPYQLRTLKIANNNFSGEIHFLNLPGVVLLDLQANQFSGEFRFDTYDKASHVGIYGDSNPFSGTAVVHSSANLVTLKKTNIVDVVDEHGKPSPKKHSILGKIMLADNPGRRSADLQLQSMLHFADAVEYAHAEVLRQVNRSLLRKLLEIQGGSQPQRLDACTWQGITCKDNVVEMIHVDQSGKPLKLIDMDWIPPTVQFVCLKDIAAVNGWVTQRLPRALRFLSMNRIYTVQRDGATARSVDLRTLPRGMEELFVRSGDLHGALCIANLPQTMRTILIRHERISEVQVDAAGLPVSIQVISVVNTLGKEKQAKEDRVRIRWVGKDKDARVTNRADTTVVESKYADVFKKSVGL